MAINSSQYKMWVIYLCVLLINGVKSTSDYFSYDTITENRIPLAVVFHDGQYQHSINRRSASATTVKPAPEKVESPSEEPLGTNTKPAYQNLEMAKMNSTLLQNRNLGVNGTGQRKDVLKPDAGHRVPPVLGTVNATNKDPLPDKNGLKPTLEVIENEKDEFTINHHTDEIVNMTAAENNATVQRDNHDYYNSTLTVDPVLGQKYWVNMSDNKNVRVSELLSASHRLAATVQLNFDFPFYGHLVPNVTIATGGFLYTGEYVHSWLAATQYIAPLMANFDTRLSNESIIKYVDNGTAFTVQWERVQLQDKRDGGEFTFQATLHKSGDIVFVYKHVPVNIDDVGDEHHPVKVGLSDAYIIDRTIFFVRRKTIYEYHRVSFSRESIKNWTVIYLTALPTCLSHSDCHSCLTEKSTSTFNCTWCPVTGRCSNGMDRNRQDWLSKGCDHKQVLNESVCSLYNVPQRAEEEKNLFNADSVKEHRSPERNGATFDDPKQESRITNDVNPGRDNVSIGVPGVITILFIVGLVAALGMWVLYAYRNPHSASGQILIRYRPSQWSWRRGEARYTAATIHM